MSPAHCIARLCRGVRRCAALSVALVVPAAWPNSYAIVDLGRGYVPAQIDDVGDMAGTFDLNKQRAELYRGGRWHELRSDHLSAAAVAVSGRVVAGNIQEDPVVWTDRGDPQSIAMPTRTSYAAALAMNDRMAVVGYYAGLDGHVHCFTWPGQGTAVDLGRMAHGSDCTATAVDRMGRVFGYANVTWHGGPRAFEWEAGRFRNLGVLPGGDTSVAAAANQYLHVVGWSNLQPGRVYPRHAFLWSGHTMKDIGAADGFDSTEAAAIDEHDDIVGDGILQADQTVHALRFTSDGTVIPLDSEVQDLSDWHLQYATGINVHGVIVGTGLRSDGTHGYMLVPQAGP